MRKPFIGLAAAGGLTLATVSALQAQIAPPFFARPAAPPAVAPAPADQRAETHQTHVQRHGSPEGRVD